jgi:hypothetical protein
MDTNVSVEHAASFLKVESEVEDEEEESILFPKFWYLFPRHVVTIT